MKKLIFVLIFTLISSQLPIFGGIFGERKSGYQQLPEKNKPVPPLTKKFIHQIPNLTSEDIELLQAVENGNVASVQQLLNSNTFGSNVLLAANNIAFRKKNQTMVSLISNALSKQFKK